MAGIACGRRVVATGGQVAAIEDVVGCSNPVPSPCVRFERDAVLSVVLSPAVPPVEHFDEQLVALRADAQPDFLFLVREIMQRHDGGVPPVVAKREHFGDVGAEDRKGAPADLGAFLPHADHALGP